MTCSKCGNSLAPDARFCPRCGASASVPTYARSVYAPGGFPLNRVARNLQTLGVLWLIYAGLRAVTGSVAILFLHGIFGSHFHHNDLNFGWSPFGHMWMDHLLPVAFFSLITSVFCIALTGYALLTRQPWGRVLAIVFAIFALFHFPLGTALGIYTLVVLGPRIRGDEYAVLAYAQHGA